MHQTSRRIVGNVGALALLALPAAILVGGAIFMAAPPEWARGLESNDSAIVGLLFQYFILAPPILIGGMVHQLIALAAPEGLSARGRWVVFAATSPMVFVVLLLGAAPATGLLTWRALVPASVLLIVYATVASPPVRSSSGSRGEAASLNGG